MVFKPILPWDNTLLGVNLLHNIRTCTRLLANVAYVQTVLSVWHVKWQTLCSYNFYKLIYMHHLGVLLPNHRACDVVPLFRVLHFPPFPSPAIWSVIFRVLHFPALRFGPSFSRSCIFHPCDLVRHFPGPALSRSCIFSHPVLIGIACMVSLRSTLFPGLSVISTVRENFRKFPEISSEY